MPQLFDTPAGPVATGHNAPAKSVVHATPVKQQPQQQQQQQKPSTTTVAPPQQQSLEMMQQLQLTQIEQQTRMMNHQQQLMQQQMQNLSLQSKPATTVAPPIPSQGYAQNMLTYAYPPQNFQSPAPPSTTNNNNNSVPTPTVAANPFEPTHVAQRIGQLLKAAPTPYPVYPTVMLPQPFMTQPVVTPQFAPAPNYAPSYPPYGGRMAMSAYHHVVTQRPQQPALLNYPPQMPQQQQQPQMISSRPAWK